LESKKKVKGFDFCDLDYNFPYYTHKINLLVQHAEEKIIRKILDYCLL